MESSTLFGHFDGWWRVDARILRVIHFLTDLGVVDVEDKPG
jgi:hypothetical protein